MIVPPPPELAVVVTEVAVEVEVGLLFTLVVATVEPPLLLTLNTAIS